MINIREAKIRDIDSIMAVYSSFVDLHKEGSRESTYIANRTDAEIANIISKGKSFVVEIENEVVGYSLFEPYENGVIGRGIILQKEAIGLGIQRMIYKMVEKKYGYLYIVVCMYNNISTQNVLKVGLIPLRFINDIDVLYGTYKD